MGEASATPTQEVQRDVVYEQWYTEMRRYRDYEHSIFSWATTVLLATIAGGVSLWTSTSDLRFGTAQSAAVAVALSVFSIVAVCVAQYAGWRYRQLKAQSEAMEPEWKRSLNKQTVSPLPRVFNPLNGQSLMVLVLCGVGVLLVLTLPANPDSAGRGQAAAEQHRCCRTPAAAASHTGERGPTEAAESVAPKGTTQASPPQSQDAAQPSGKLSK